MFFCLLLTGCVTSDSYEARTPGPYDGKWKGKFFTNDAPCKSRQVSAVGEIKYGKLVGILKENSWKVADVKGMVGTDGKLDGPLRVNGSSGAKIDLQFKPETAFGIWQSDECRGTVELVKY